MNSDAAHRRIRSALRAELKRRHGQIGQIESELSRSEGYLSRFCRGDMELTLKGCLEVLEALEIEPGSFFSATFGTVTASEDILRTLEGQGPFDRGIASFEDALGKISSTLIKSDKADRRHRASVSDLENLPVDAQLRRLRTGKKYRTETFVGGFLAWLERLRYDDPRAAARLTLGLVVYVIPELACCKSKRVEWLCRCAEVYTSCLRSTNESRSAARLFRLALGWSRTHELSAETAALLRRSAFVASDFAEYECGQFILREAQEIALELDNRRELGFIFITRAMLLNYSGDSERSMRSYERGIKEVGTPVDAEARRWLLGAYSGLVNVFTNMGDMDRARHWMSRATAAFQNEGGLILGKLSWQKGSIERAMGYLVEAERSLRTAREMLERGSSMEYALVSIELASVLLELKNQQEALKVAKSLVVLTKVLDGNPLAEGAFLEFMRIILAGGLDLAILEELRVSIESGRPVVRSARARS